MKLLSLSVCLLFAFAMLAQPDSYKLKSDMAFYGDAVMNVAHTEHRLRANDSLESSVDRFLSTPNSFAIDLKDVPWLSVVQDSAQTFRLITWQLNHADTAYTYFGRLQLNSGRVFQLTDDKSSPEPLFSSGDHEHWYGARYSSMVEFQRNNKRMYVLFGFNAHSKWNRQKVADVLTIEESGPTFGMPVFAESGQDADRYGRSRILMTYSADVRANLNYDNKLKMIVSDRLVPMRGRFPGQGETFVTDGTFEGYKLNQSGNWIYQENLFSEVIEEPIDDGRDRSSEAKKDIFGRTRQ